MHRCVPLRSADSENGDVDDIVVVEQANRPAANNCQLLLTRSAN